MLIKTNELSGAALDWAVAKAVGYTQDEDAYCDPAWMADGRFIASCHSWHPSTSWAQCGLLVDEFDVWLSSDDDTHCASTHPHVNEYIRTGPTKLVAACRAIVHAKLGDEVEVPDDLLSAPL
ncbi:MAG: phage protein NinX family protein [Aeromonadaceae bacterium]